jgi:hypothetical protein
MVVMDISKEMAPGIRRQQIAHAGWSIACILLLIFGLSIFNIDPLGIGRIFIYLEKSHQRKMVYDRVQGLGGWEILRRDSENIIYKYHESDFRWIEWETNKPALPDSLTALKARIIGIDEKTDFGPILQIHIFGMWHSGSAPTPRYEIWITQSNLPSSFDPELLVSRPWELYGGAKVHYVTNQIYEVF